MVLGGRCVTENAYVAKEEKSQCLNPHNVFMCWSTITKHHRPGEKQQKVMFCNPGTSGVYPGIQEWFSNQDQSEGEIMVISVDTEKHLTKCNFFVTLKTTLIDLGKGGNFFGVKKNLYEKPTLSYLLME